MDLYHGPRALSSQFEPRIRVRLFGQQLLRKAAETRTANFRNAQPMGRKPPLRANATASFGALGRCMRAYKTPRRRLASVWSLSRSRGLTMNASAPNWRLLFSYSGLPLTTTIAVFFAESDFIRRHTSIPSTPGMLMSRINRSGLLRPTSINAVIPSLADVTS